MLKVTLLGTGGMMPLKERALAVPRAMQGCLPLEPDELMQLKRLLDKALHGMEEHV